jgi:uncharacterized protein YkwD
MPDGVGSKNDPYQDTISLLPPARSSLPNYRETGEFTTDIARWLNAVRQAVGLPALPQQENVQQSAQNHANYQVMNHTNGHSETPGLPGFTGTRPSARIAATHPTNLAGEVTVYYTGYGPKYHPSGVKAIQTLIDAPFHRIIMLSDFKVMGVGYDSDYKSDDVIVHTGFNVDFADNAKTLNHSYLITYPYANQMEIPTEWYAKEDPNPFGTTPRYIGKMVGYPVTIQGATTDRLIISSFNIETSAGTKMPCREIDPQTRAIGGYLHGAAMCVPYQPYTPNTEYIATVSGTKNGQPFTVTWNWITRAAALTTASVAASMVSVASN